MGSAENGNGANSGRGNSSISREDAKLRNRLIDMLFFLVKCVGIALAIFVAVPLVESIGQVAPILLGIKAEQITATKELLVLLFFVFGGGGAAGNLIRSREVQQLKATIKEQEDTIKSLTQSSPVRSKSRPKEV